MKDGVLSPHDVEGFSDYNEEDQMSTAQCFQPISNPEQQDLRQESVDQSTIVQPHPPKAIRRGQHFFILPNGSILILIDMITCLPIMWFTSDGVVSGPFPVEDPLELSIIDFNAFFISNEEVIIAILTSDRGRQSEYSSSCQS